MNALVFFSYVIYIKLNSEDLSHAIVVFGHHILSQSQVRLGQGYAAAETCCTGSNIRAYTN